MEAQKTDPKAAAKAPAVKKVDDAPVKLMTGIALPDAPYTSKQKYPFATMDVNAMFFVPNRSAVKFAPYAAKFTRSNAPKKYVVRDMVMKPGKDVGVYEVCKPDDPKAITGTGCWRVADAVAA